MATPRACISVARSDADVAHVPRLELVPGDRLRAVRIADHEAEAVAVGRHPLPLGGVGEAGLDLAPAAAEVRGQAGLVLAVAGPGAAPLGALLPEPGDGVAEQALLVAVGAVGALRP